MRKLGGELGRAVEVVRVGEAAQEVKQHGLARAVGAAQHHELAAANREVVRLPESPALLAALGRRPQRAVDARDHVVIVTRTPERLEARRLLGSRGQPAQALRVHAVAADVGKL